MLSWDDEGLRLSVGNQELCFPAVWLRDNCPRPTGHARTASGHLRQETDDRHGEAGAA